MTQTLCQVQGYLTYLLPQKSGQSPGGLEGAMLSRTGAQYVLGSISMPSAEAFNRSHTR